MFVERDEQWKIKGVYGAKQEGYAEEELPDDHPEVLAFLNPPKDYAQLRREEYNKRGVTIEAIAEAIIEKEGGRLDKLQALMMIRDAVRAEVPKI